MKKFTITFLAFILWFSFSVEHVQAQDEAFIFKCSGSTVYLKASSVYSYKYDVDWNNDGIYDDFNVTGDLYHEYDYSSDENIIRIKGEMPHLMSPSSNGYRNYIIEVYQWGDIKWKSMEALFKDSYKLRITAEDTPDLSEVYNMMDMFCLVEEFHGDISQWDVSNVRYMQKMFYSAKDFNSDLSQWDVSNVRNMEGMFWGAKEFDRDLSQWDVSKVTDMNHMFASSAFSGDISQWNVSSVTDMNHMFSEARNFNRDLSNWDVSNVEDMGGMFSYATAFNGDISQWNVFKVTNMGDMFCSALVFNEDISQWNVSSVTNMGSMFADTEEFNRVLSNWDVSNVEYMAYMFYSATAFNEDISQWNVSSVTDMNNMFFQASSFNTDLSNWDVSNVGNMESMFCLATAFNGDISQWDVSSVTEMRSMFSGATAFNGDISQWNVSRVWDMNNMLRGTSLPTPTYNQVLINWSKLNLCHGVRFHAGNSTYSSEEAKAAHFKIRSDFNWFIDDGGFNVGIHEVLPKKICIYPNPTSGEIKIDIADVDFLSEIEYIEIRDSKGNCVFKRNFPKDIKIQTALEPGIYISNIKTTEKIYSEKIIVY